MTLAALPGPAGLPRRAASTDTEAGNAIAAAAEGYSFPTNLDSDPPMGGLAPKTQAELTREALHAGTAPEAFAPLVREHAARRQP